MNLLLKLLYFLESSHAVPRATSPDFFPSPLFFLFSLSLSSFSLSKLGHCGKHRVHVTEAGGESLGKLRGRVGPIQEAGDAGKNFVLADVVADTKAVRAHGAKTRVSEERKE